jgi:hypothetical protein
VTITRIDLERNKIHVEKAFFPGAASAHLYQLDLSPRTKVIIDGAAATPEQLRPGDQGYITEKWASYGFMGAMEVVAKARRIEVTRPRGTSR